MRYLYLLLLLTAVSCKKEHQCNCFHANGAPGPENHAKVGTKKAANDLCKELHDIYSNSGGHCVLIY